MSIQMTTPVAPAPVHLADRVVVVAGEDSPLTQGLGAALEAAGGRVARLCSVTADPNAVRVDMSQSGAVLEAFEAVRARLGAVDALVFASFPEAASRPVPVAEMEDSHFEAVWERPMQAALFCFQAAYRQFLHGGRGGTLVAVVPTIAMSGGPRFSASAAAAEGQRLLIKSAARQWGPDGVTANTVAVAPGLLIPETPNFEQSLAERALGRVGDPAIDLGPIVAFLASGAGRFLTGSTLFADGGLWMSAP